MAHVTANLLQRRERAAARRVRAIGEQQDEHAAIALGYISIYNHSYSPNAQLEQMLDELMMEIIAIKDIEAGEEITIKPSKQPRFRAGKQLKDALN